MPKLRIRLAVGLVSLAMVGLELALMQALSLRFWSHFAYMVISVAMLGFGASGTAVTLLRRRIITRQRAWLFAVALAMAMSVPAMNLTARQVPLNVQFLAWDLSQVGNVVLLELCMFVPFFLAGGFVCVALMDKPQRISGHYAASLIGSGLGAVAAVVLMYVLTTEQLLGAMGCVSLLAAVVLLPQRAAAVLALAVGGLIFVFTVPSMPQPMVSQYKMLSYVKSMPGTKTIYRAKGPLGRIDVVAGPGIHYAPGLSLQYTQPVPPHVLLIADGDQTSPIYDCKGPEDWAFGDHTTAAVAYHLRRRPEVLIVGAGGGAEVGLAVFHQSAGVVALEMNRQIIEAMTGPLAERGGGVYHAPAVSVVNREARGYLASTGRLFDIIQLPAIDAFGASGAGLYATNESYLYTVESFEAMLDRLDDRGVLCITRWMRTPPRDGLKIFDTAAAALRRKGLDPSRRLAMIRSWVTVTVLAFRQPITDAEADKVRSFCRQRSFDLCYLPDIAASEANRWHKLDRPYYFEAARDLLGPKRSEFLDEYLFNVVAATDDKPYFYHFFRWRYLPELRRQLGGRSPAFLELGFLMLAAALIQAVLLGGLMILLPLAPGIGALRYARGPGATLGYFLLLGVGFMLLEMAFLQKLILYMAHPIYSAAVVIGSFLVFAGLGSQLSRYWGGSLKRLIVVAAAVIVSMAMLYLFVLDRWLAITQHQPTPVRFVLAAATIAPLALAMGHMFPAGLRQLSGSAPVLVPWAWAINGFASVVATVMAPLVAMNVGFRRLAVVAVACYALAGLIGCRLPAGDRKTRRKRAGKVLRES